MRSAQPRLPSLDAIGNSVHCWRGHRESDREYSHRLALHIQTLIIETEDRRDEFEKLVTAVLAVKVNRNLQEHPAGNSPSNPASEQPHQTSATKNAAIFRKDQP